MGDQYEDLRIKLQDAIIEWARAGADRYEIEQEVQTTFDNAPDYYGGIDHLREDVYE